MTRRLSLMCAQATVSVALLAWVARGLDTRALGHLLLTLPSWYYLASFAVIIGGQALYAWRWWLLLSIAGVDVPLSTALRYYFIGVFANNFLPSTVGGDAAKVYYLGQEHGYRTIVASVVVDRMLGLGSLAVLAAAAAWWLPAASPRFVALRLVVTAAAVGSVAVIGLVMFGTGGLQRWLAPFGARAVRLGQRLQRLRLDMAQLLRHPRILGYAGAIVFGYFVALSLVYASFVAISGPSRPSLVAIFAAVSMTGVLTNVPVSLNGLGVREQLHAWLFVPLGVPKEAAVAISLLLFVHVLVASLCGMVLWLTRPGAVAVPDADVREASAAGTD
jgi:uncharacterized protein (TIRG00374 family)